MHFGLAVQNSLRKTEDLVKNADEVLFYLNYYFIDNRHYTKVEKENLYKNLDLIEEKIKRIKQDLNTIKG